MRVCVSVCVCVCVFVCVCVYVCVNEEWCDTGSVPVLLRRKLNFGPLLL